jgi:hypothetical protein
VPNTKTYISAEMLGTVRVQHRQLRVPGHWKKCRGASRVAVEEARSHLSGFLSPGHLEDLSTRGGGGSKCRTLAVADRRRV